MNIKLKAQTREKKEKLPQDYTAAVVYGSKSDNILLKLNANELIKAYEQAGESSLIELEIDDQDSVKVLVKDIQRHPVKDSIIHIDFYKVDMNKEISTEIPLNYVGESKVVKEQGALLVKNLDSLRVECLPKDLLDHIDIDISKLESLGDVIKVEEIDLPESLKVLDNPDDSVVTVVESREDEEMREAPVEGEEEEEGDEDEDEEESSSDESEDSSDSKPEEK